MLSPDIENILIKEFNLTAPRAFIDSRSPYFFHVQDESKNYMFLFKKEFPDDLMNKLLPYCRDPYSYFELPKITKENSDFALFTLPKGKLFRLTEEKITAELQTEVLKIQQNLNLILKDTPYSWAWDLPYFFKTSQGLMYIDFESIEENTQPSIFTPQVFEKMNTKEKVLMKIQRLKGKSH